MSKFSSHSTIAGVLLVLAGCSQSPAPAPVDATTPAASSVEREAGATVAQAADAASGDAASAAIAESPAVRYEGKIIKQPMGAGGKLDGWYFVENGKKRWISNPDWVQQNGYSVESVVEISAADFSSIPEDPAPLGN